MLCITNFTINFIILVVVDCDHYLIYVTFTVSNAIHNKFHNYCAGRSWLFIDIHHFHIELSLILFLLYINHNLPHQQLCYEFYFILFYFFAALHLLYKICTWDMLNVNENWSRCYGLNSNAELFIIPYLSRSSRALCHPD